MKAYEPYYNGDQHLCIVEGYDHPLLFTFCSFWPEARPTAIVFSLTSDRRCEFFSAYHRKHPKLPRDTDFQVAVAVSIL